MISVTQPHNRYKIRWKNRNILRSSNQISYQTRQYRNGPKYITEIGLTRTGVGFRAANSREDIKRVVRENGEELSSAACIYIFISSQNPGEDLSRGVVNLRTIRKTLPLFFPQAFSRRAACTGELVTAPR